MRHALLAFLIATLCSPVLGQGQADTPATRDKVSRDQLIRGALAREEGEITVMEAASGSGGGVIIGYTSGALVKCSGDRDCREFDGTPSGAVIGAVTAIAVATRSGQEIIWAAYPHGVVYQCIDYACREVIWSGARDD